jgi:hypothetical protein
MRENVAEDLTESHGWFEDTSSPQVFKRRDAKWEVIGANGASLLTVAGGPGNPGYTVAFGPNVPHFLIVRACAEATADCWRCGTACEGDCSEPDGVTFGVDGDGVAYSRVL